MTLYVDIKKDLGDFRLNVKFECRDERLALLGASGCGKSMTLKCIAGIEKPDSGKIILNGRALFDSEKKIDLTPQQRKVGYLFQQYALFPDMSVEENIRAGVREGSKAEKKQAAASMIARFRLNGLEKKLPAALSGGQQQRTALARILVNKPEVILLDEPFTALDSYLKWKLEMELDDILNDFRKDVIYVSHSRDEVYRLCDNVCVLTGGRSEDKKDIKSLFSEPDTVSAALISGCKNISPASAAENGTAFLADWNITLKSAHKFTEETDFAGIRAHYIKPANGERENTVRCRVERVIEDVFTAVIMVCPPGCKSGCALRMETDKETWKKYAGSDEIDICIPADAVMPLK